MPTRMPPQPLLVLAGLLLAPSPSVTQTASTGAITSITETQLAAFRPRLIGPAVAGGRVHDIEALPNDPSTIFVASASGGLWKTTNRGHTWRNVFSDQAISTFGDVAIAPSDPDILYVGTGEQNNRQSSSWGNGVYRSDDGGETFRHVGLVETRHIGKVLIHPTDPDIVYVAALGNLWRGNEERAYTERETVGAPGNAFFMWTNSPAPSTWSWTPKIPESFMRQRTNGFARTWGFNGGGPGSGIRRSIDGGDTWRELTNGIPPGGQRPHRTRDLPVGSAHSECAHRACRRSRPGYLPQRGTGGTTWRRVNSLDPRPMLLLGNLHRPLERRACLCPRNVPHTRVKTADAPFGDRRAAHIRRGRTRRPPRALDRPR